MQWISVNEYLPGYRIKKSRILILLSNGETHILGNRSMEKEWAGADMKVHSVTHWMEIKPPEGRSFPD